MAINRMNEEGYDDPLITKISLKILDVLPTIGWSVAIEDDYSDLKNYLCSRDEAIAEAFTRLDMVIMTPELDTTPVDGVFIHFLFHADPARLPEDRQAFGRVLRKDKCRVLRTACEAVLCAAAINFTEPAVKVRYRPKCHLTTFGGSVAVHPAYTIEISYWIAAKKFSFLQKNFPRIV